MVAEKTSLKLHDYFVENLLMDNLYKLIEQHKLHLDFLKGYNLCTDEKSYSIIKKIEGVFDIIAERISKVTGVDDGLSNRPVSN